MDAFDSTTNQAVEEFNQTLDTMTSFYRRQAYLAGLAQAKLAWDAMHALRPTTRLGRAKKHLLFAAVTAMVGVAAGLALRLLLTHQASFPTFAVPQSHPLADWLNLVK